jgi:predicted RNase H-like HicB family nuclease
MEAIDLTNASFSNSDRYYDYDSDAVSSSEEQSRTPVLLYGEIIKGWFLSHPLMAYLEYDGETLIFSEDLFGIYGQGKSVNEAVEDYCVALTEYYDLLKRHADAVDRSREAFDHLARFFSPK